jgi:hypothetical protein
MTTLNNSADFPVFLKVAFGVTKEFLKVISARRLLETS